MALSPGTRLAAFEIVALVGSGGMGEVYRARDTRLDRIVAIKVLNEAELGDASPRRIERFRQEARAIARITHPNICTLYDVAQEGSTTFLVMEFVEGTTLARRLEDGPLPLATALKIAVQIADALDHAHRQGVVHRDLKPSNIMLARDRVKLLDFGLAKLKEPDERAAVVAATATQLTEAHTIVGTAPYMSPEQIEGRDVDARTDIFAFGIVLYEMIAGRRPFAGDSRISVLSAIVGGEPLSLAALQPGTPPAVERLVARCLAKDPDDRWQTARDLAAEVRWIAESGAPSGLAARSPSIRAREAAAWVVAVVLGSVVAGLFIALSRISPAPAPAVTRFIVQPPGGGFIHSPGVLGSPIAVSPDGRHLAFLAETPGDTPRLYVRSLDGVDSRLLPGTDGAQQPFWSPDSTSIGFFASGRLQRISIAGGEPQTICDASFAGGGATWNQDGIILFTPVFEGAAVHRVSEDGGTPTPVTKLDAALHDSAHLWPTFLPDGRHFIFERLASENTGLYLASLDSGPPKLLVRAGRDMSDIPNLPAFAPPRHLLYVRRGTLMAQALDLDRLELAGDAFPVAEGVHSWGPAAAYSVSQNGVLAYWSGGRSTTQLTWIDRAGQVLGTAGAPGPYRHVALSPDGAHAAVDTGAGAASGIRVVDIRRGAIAPLVAGIAVSPVWSPDGDAVLFSAARDTPPNLFLKRLNAPGDGERLVDAPIQQFPLHWSLDGQSVVYARLDPETKWDLWVMPMAGDRSPAPFLNTPANEALARISPDGQWIAYQSDESGRYEVYVTSYPQPGRRWPVSVNGGTSPIWRKDGREIYYDSADHRLMAVPVGFGPIFTPGVPVPLFALRAIRVVGGGLGWSYDVAPDGRFLVNTLIERSAAPLTVVLNWPTGVGKD
jgi:Tol biopolymer transport system component